METPALYDRRIESRIAESLQDTPVVLLAGPRQAGKTTLVRHESLLKAPPQANEVRKPLGGSAGVCQASATVPDKATKSGKTA